MSRSATRTPQQRLILAIAITASFVAFLDSSVVNVALPAIVKQLGGGLTTQQWTVDAYLLTLGSLILVAGSVSDAFGRQRVLRIGLILFGIASLATAAAPTAGVLIAARLLQGVAGAMLVPSSLALIASTFDGAERGRAIGTWTAATSGAMIAGPLLGGLAVDLASWRWAFVINVLPIAAAMYLLTRVEAGDVRSDNARSDNARSDNAHVDLVSAALCALGLGGAVFALIEQPNLGWGDPAVWGAGLGGAAVFGAFVWRQARIARPMLPLGLFAARNFAWGNISTLLVYGALGLNGFVVSVYLQERAGLTATAAGLSTMPITVALIVLSSRAGVLAGRIGPRLFMTLGPLAMAGGALLMLTVSEPFNYWTQLLPGVMLFGVGVAATVSPLTAAVLGAVDSARSGIASAVNNAVARVAGLVTVAALGAVVGGQLDLAGFHRAVAFTAVLLALGGVASWVGIRNVGSVPEGRGPGNSLVRE
ncbi:MFS transporter [Demequina lutea]|uniref:EmrB/QacA subfamily drug resistance transporter n=1 Tax=Demequina lutea TaxID=431489 RepID=A0A7Z0CJ25_9MICO|nr:MFS transporter [Demequina lutea]NYI42584.1 EmrB/QacA subfamily drug resistance transporter [Demequina lutea]